MPPSKLPDPRCAAVQGRLSELLAHLDTSALDGRHLFLTGGTGFFGYWLISLIDLLNGQGVPIQLTILSRNPSAFLARAPFFGSRPWLAWCSGSIQDFQMPNSADFMIHAATDTGAAAHAKPLALMDDILLGTRHCLAQAALKNVQRAVYVSSGAVYGTQPADIARISETAAFACDATSPSSAYGEAKRAAEQWCVQFGSQYDIAIPIARCFAFVGPGLPLDGHFAIGNFIADALAARPIQVNGDGTPLRSYLYGADLAVWLMKILLAGRHGRAYNVGADDALSIAALAHKVRDTLAPTQSVIINAKAPPDVLRSRYIPDIERARSELNLDAWTSLPQALRFTATDNHTPQ